MLRRLVFLIFFDFILATPRLALENGATCATCHINPTGGALRNLHGIEIVSLDELPSRHDDRFYPASYTGIVNEFLRLGGDFRVQAFSYETDNRRHSRLIPMQAELYGWLSLSPNLGFFMEADLNPTGAGQEYWVLIEGISGTNWIKIGKSVPNYGLKLDNHTSFIRGGSIRQNYGLTTNLLPFSPLLRKPVLVEGGIPLTHNILITLGAAENLIPGTSSESAFETFTGMIQIHGRNPLSRHMFSLQFMHLPDRWFTGISGGLGHTGFTFLSEIDLVQDPETRSLIFYQDMTWLVSQGFHLTGTYEYIDPDLAYKTGSLSRFAIGFDYFPIPLVELIFQARIHRTDTVTVASSAPEYFFQLHTWF